MTYGGRNFLLSGVNTTGVNKCSIFWAVLLQRAVPWGAVGRRDVLHGAGGLWDLALWCCGSVCERIVSITQGHFSTFKGTKLFDHLTSALQTFSWFGFSKFILLPWMRRRCTRRIRQRSFFCVQPLFCSYYIWKKESFWYCLFLSTYVSSFKNLGKSVFPSLLLSLHTWQMFPFMLLVSNQTDMSMFF